MRPTEGPTVRLTADIRYDAAPDAVFAMLCDEEFQARRCVATGALEHDVTVEEYDDGGVVVTAHRTMPTDQVPDFVRTFVGATLVVSEIQDWQAADAAGGREGTLVLEIKGAPVRMTGTLRLTAEGAGTVENIDCDLKASVPLVGGKIEKSVEPAIRSAIRVEEREGRSWLARG
jgi:hypothetical protein